MTGKQLFELYVGAGLSIEGGEAGYSWKPLVKCGKNDGKPLQRL